VINPWQSFADELLRWQDSGRVVDFWWRDDDAARPSDAFNRLTALATQASVPLGLAVIPQQAELALFARLGVETAVLQHGVDHRNRAPKGEKPSEFPATEANDLALARIAAGRSRLLQLAGSRLLPVLVPPWNRFSAALIEGLPGLGIRGFSTFSPRTSREPVRNLRQVNAHVDIISWKRGRVFVGEERALAKAVTHLAQRRTGVVDPIEPTGWLTHHACHDETIWGFLERLFEHTRARAGVRWLSSVDVFLGDASA
jgi:hypothetical protein